MELLWIFVKQPGLAFVVAGFFAALWLPSQSKFALIASIGWVLFAVNELLISNGVLCSAECNIRVDLLFTTPVLLLGSLFAAIQSILRYIFVQRKKLRRPPYK